MNTNINFISRGCYPNDLDNFSEKTFSQNNFSLSIWKKEIITISESVFGNTLDIEIPLNIVWLNILEYSLVIFNTKTNEIVKNISTVSDRFFLFEKINYVSNINDFHKRDLEHHNELFDLENSENLNVGIFCNLIKRPHLLINDNTEDDPSFSLKDFKNNNYVKKLKELEFFIETDKTFDDIKDQSFFLPLNNIYSTLYADELKNNIILHINFND